MISSFFRVTVPERRTAVLASFTHGVAAATPILGAVCGECVAVRASPDSRRIAATAAAGEPVQPRMRSTASQKSSERPVDFRR